MSELVKPGGFVFVGVPYVMGPLCSYYATPFATWREWLGRPMSVGALKRLFLENGLTPLESKKYFFRFFVGILGQKQSTR